MKDVSTLQKRLKGLLIKRPGFVVALIGPAGIGKTFNVQSLLRETSCRHLSVHATTSPNQLTRALPKPKKPQVWAERTLSRIETGELVETKTILDLLGATLLGLAPFILHLEDIHELAGDQLEFVSELARVVQRLKGVALLVTSRTKPAEVFEVVTLNGLSDNDAQAILEREAGAKLPLAALEWIQVRAAGNPLFTLEFFRFLARQGSLWNDGQRWHWREPPGEAIPATVEALIEHQLNSVLSNSSLNTELTTHGLYAKALLPKQLDVHLWQEVLGCDVNALQQVQLALEHGGILHENQFVHPLIPEVALNLIPSQLKQWLSVRLFAALKMQQPELATQFMVAAGTDPAQRLEVLQRAAEVCGDQKRQGHFLYEAVSHAQGQTRAELAWTAAKILQSHDIERALEMCNEALQISDRNAVVDVMALLLARKNDVVALESLLERTQSEMSVEEIRVRSLVTLGRYPDVIGLWEANPALQETTNTDVLYAVALAYLATRQFLPFEALLNRVETSSNTSMQDEQRNKFMNLRATYRIDRGEHVAAINDYRTVIENSRKSVNLYSLGAVLHNLGIAYKTTLQYELAQSTLNESINIRRTSGDARQYAFSQCVMAEIQADLGLQSEAETTIQEALSILALQPGSHFHIAGLSQASNVYSQSFAPMAAMLQLKYASQALMLARAGQNKNLLMEILYDHVMALVRNHNQNEVSRSLEEFASLNAVVDNPGYRWRFKNAQAHVQEMIGSLELAKSFFVEAIALAEAIHDPFNVQKLGLEVDRLESNQQSARQRLEWFKSKGMMAAAELTQRYFPNLLTRPTDSPTDMPSDHSSIPASLRLEVLGSMQIKHDHNTEPVRGHKRQELLAVLLETRMTGRTEISRLQLLDTLYPDEDETQANSSLKQAIRTIRASFGAEIVQTTSNGYALGHITSDAEEFLKTGDTNLWRGPYLAGDLNGQDDGLRESLYAALLGNAQGLLPSDPEEALRVGKLLMAFDAFNLEHLELCVRALQLRNNHKSLNRLYNEARAGLLEVAEIIPERWQDFLKTSQGLQVT